MSIITTHVLDVVLGKPGAGIAVRLDKQDGGGWIEVSSDDDSAQLVEDTPRDWIGVSTGVTDADGRCRALAAYAEPGVYRLTFSTGAYLEGLGRTTIYPEISVIFNCCGETHYHLPLLLSDNGYTTYRGS